MASVYLYAAILALNLSHAPAEANYGSNRYLAEQIQRDNRGNCVGNCNPFSGARGFAVTLSKDTWYTQKDPVPYASLWANPLNQTAQQFVAILSVLQDDGLYIDGFMDDWPR